MLFLGNLGCTRIKRLIFLVFQILACEFLQDLISLYAIFFIGKLTQNGIQKFLCHIVGITVCCLNLNIGIRRIDTKSGIGRQGPGSSCPCQEIGILSHYLKADDGRPFLYGLVALGNLLRRKRSTTSGTIGNNLESFIKKLLLPDFLQCPPLRLNIIILISNIGVLHISPKTNGIGEILPHALIFPYGFLTLLNERLHTILFDLLLAV